jgi:ketosteroid isomerase-like protein
MSDANTITREVEAAYQVYIDLFNREDAAGFVNCFAYPHAMLTGEQGLLMTATAADQQRFHQKVMTDLHGRGWGRSGIDLLQVWPLSDSLVLLAADVTRYKTDGSVLEKVRAGYTLRRESGAWKILTLMVMTSGSSTIVEEVDAFYRGFIDGFNREDTDMYLRSFCYPNATLSGEQGLTVRAKESEQQRFYQEVMVAIQGRGWDHTGITHLQAWPLGNTLAMLVADIARYKRDKTVIEQGRYWYTVRKESGSWKILTLAEVKPPFTGPEASR